jgi:ATP-dependent helicase/nuclease subunit B
MKAFHILSWRRDCIRTLAEHLPHLCPQARHTADLSHFLVVFPHRRPGRRLLLALHEHPDLPSPLRPPKTMSGAEFFSQLRGELAALEGDDAPPSMVVDPLDRVAVTMDCVRELARSKEHDGRSLLARLPLEDSALFMPWGLRLESLFEEFLQQNKDPGDIPYAGEHVQPFAAGLLEQLGAIFQAYLRRMAEKGWSTPGLDARYTARRHEQVLSCLRGRTVIFAGFHHLDGVQDLLFRKLWENGAQVILHSDPALAQGAENVPHWSCREQERWIKRWQARPSLLSEEDALEPPPPDVRFHEGFDLHSQLDALQRELANVSDAEALIVLPDTALLMPTLHALPDADVNISMGYPLARTPLARLVETLMRMQETRRENGAYYWRDCIECLRHPYLKMLAPKSGSPEDAVPDLRLVFHAMENDIRQGQAYFAPLHWERNHEADEGGLAGFWHMLAGEADPTGLRELFLQVLETCFTAWERLETLADLARTLERLCDLMLEHGHGLWQRFPIDAECLHRLLYSVTPALLHNAMSQTPHPQETLFTILRERLAAERVPFESEKVQGLQVLGILETRLLRADTVLVLDATDDNLPGQPAMDPLLPDPLRRLAGLPDSSLRDETKAHAFFSLLHGARQAVLLYQTSTESTGLSDDKRIRSRFVEELLWQLEQKAGQILKPGTPPIHTLVYPTSAPQPFVQAVDKTPAVLEALERRLARSLSPSALDDYLACPLRFYLRRLAGLEPAQEVGEDADPAAVGELVHASLAEFFGPLVNTDLHPGVCDPETLLRILRRRLAESQLHRQIPPHQRLLLEKASDILLRRYLEAMPPTRIIRLESELAAIVEAQGGAVPLLGRADRIDRRDEGAVILDYKTGVRLPLPHKELWEDASLFARLEAWPECADPDTLPRELAAALPSVQLPFYLYCYWQGADEMPWDAALVDLADSGGEKGMFSSKAEAEERQAVISERIPVLLRFLVHHMRTAPAFAPVPGDGCQWCDYAGSCRRG